MSTSGRPEPRAFGRRLRVWPLVLVVAVLAWPRLLPASGTAKAVPPAALGATHVVAAGQTLFRIGRAYGVPVAALLEANGLTSATALRIGQRLVIPGARHVVRVEPAQPLTVEEREQLERSLRQPAALPPPRAEPPSLRLRTDGVLVWPILAPINSPFGPRWGSFHAGIDLGSPQYQQVVAAADAEVLYAAETRGPLGQAVVLQHAEGLRTVYAHLSVLIAREGETVRQGQAIGGVGSTGRTTGPHLHFEVRRNGVAIDPAPLLPATIDELVQGLGRARGNRERPPAP